MSPASVRAPQSENIPLSLKRERRWVGWKTIERDGKKSKLPFNVRTGKLAEANNYKTWATFEEACTAYLQGEVEAIGYVLKPGQIGLDCDGCFVNGVMEPWAEEALTAVPSYAERSPSGTGLHIIADSNFIPPEGQIEKDFPDHPHHGIAFYVYPRFLCMTGAKLNDCEVTDQTEALDALHLKYFPERDKTKPKRRKKAQAAAEDNDPEPEPEPAPKEPLTEDDEKLLARARSARNGVKFQRLWNGQLADYAGDHSRADAALIRLLAFWTRDPNRLERLFVHSKLGEREKWRTRADYRSRTIAFVLSRITLFLLSLEAKTNLAFCVLLTLNPQAYTKGTYTCMCERRVFLLLRFALFFLFGSETKMNAPDEKALAQIRKLGAFKPSPESTVQCTIDSSVAETVGAELEAAPLAADDPQVWKAHPYRGEKGLEAWIRRMQAQAGWWLAHPPAPKPEKPKPRGQKKKKPADAEESLWIAV